MHANHGLLADLKVLCNCIQDELDLLLCWLRPSCDLRAAVCSMQKLNCLVQVCVSFHPGYAKAVQTISCLQCSISQPSTGEASAN